MARVLTCILFILLLAAPGLAREPVVLVTNEYPPYVMEKGSRPGLLVEIVTAAFAAQGLEVDIRFRPWRRCALLIRTGEAFAAFPYAKTSERDLYAWFTDPIWVCNNVFFYLKGRLGNYDFTSLKDLRRFTIAGTSGNYYENIFEEAGLTMDYAPGEASGVRKLWEMRCTLFAEDELVGWTLISRIFPSRKQNFGSTATPWRVNPQHLMVSKIYPHSRELIAKFNKGLAAIRDDGVYDRLVESYFNN